jgi:hypothetical protein
LTNSRVFVLWVVLVIPAVITNIPANLITDGAVRNLTAWCGGVLFGSCGRRIRLRRKTNRRLIALRASRYRGCLITTLIDEKMALTNPPNPSASDGGFHVFAGGLTNSCVLSGFSLTEAPPAVVLLLADKSLANILGSVWLWMGSEVRGSDYRRRSADLRWSSFRSPSPSRDLSGTPRRRYSSSSSTSHIQT